MSKETLLPVENRIVLSMKDLHKISITCPCCESSHKVDFDPKWKVTNYTCPNKNATFLVSIEEKLYQKLSQIEMENEWTLEPNNKTLEPIDKASSQSSNLSKKRDKKGTHIIFKILIIFLFLIFLIILGMYSMIKFERLQLSSRINEDLYVALSLYRQKEYQKAVSCLETLIKDLQIKREKSQYNDIIEPALTKATSLHKDAINRLDK